MRKNVCCLEDLLSHVVSVYGMILMIEVKRTTVFFLLYIIF